MEKRIFISHSSKDHAVAEVICNALEANGVKCWIAPRDIPYGAAWAGEISKAISDSSAFLFLSSEKSNASNQVSREIQLAIENGLTIIPIKLDGTQYNDANKYYLATIHCVIEYDASKTHKIVEDIIKNLPEESLENTESDNNKKEKKPRKKRYVLTLLAAVFASLLLVVLALYLCLFTEISFMLKCVLSAILGVLSLGAVFVCYRRASKSYSVSKLKINILLVAFFVLAAGFAFGGIKMEEYLWREDIDTKYHIVVEAPTDMSAEDFSDAVNILSERLEILCEGERFVFETEGNKVQIIIPRAVFNDELPEDVFRHYLSRAMKLTLTTTTLYLGDNKPEYPEYVSIDRSDIVSITNEFGKVEGADPSKYGITEEEYDYFKIVFTEDFCKKNAKTIAHYGDKLILAQDKAEVSNCCYYELFKGKEVNTYYFIDGGKLNNLSKLIIHNYTSEPMKGSLLFEITLAPEWEEVSKIKNAGEKQIDAKSLEDNTVTFSYVPSLSDVTEGEWTDVKATLKHRLDIIGSEYAFGTEIGKENTAVVRATPEKLGIHIMELLCANKFAIQGDYSYIYVSGSEKDFKLVDNKNGSLALEYTPSYEEKINSIKFLSELSVKEDDGYLYLVSVSSDYLPVLRGKLSSNGVVVFDEIALGINEKTNAENSFIAEICFDALNNALKTDIEVSKYIFDNEENTEADFGYSENEAQLQEKIKEIYPDAEIGISSRTITVQCHMQIDQNLPSEMIKKAKEIFDMTDFENSEYHQLSIYFVDEIEEERARIFFAKYPKTYYDDSSLYKNGFTYTYGVFDGGRIARDKEVFLEIVYNDEFFKQYIHEDDGMIAFKS